jgi:hypothetical protein
MILFTLRCARGHQFEGWFRDGDGFEAQQKSGEISCPECGETKVEKAVMAPRLGKPHRRFRRIAVGLGVTEEPSTTQTAVYLTETSGPAKYLCCASPTDA